MREEIDNFVDAHLDTLRDRAKRCVCNYCGGQLELREIVYSNCANARTEVFCSECGRMDWGCEPLVHDVAAKYLHESAFDCYKDMASSTLKDEMNQARLCEFLSWGLENLGLLDDSGFTQKVNPNKGSINSILSWSREEIQSISQQERK